MTVPRPAGVVAGDVMLAVYMSSAGHPNTTPAGWTQVQRDAASSSHSFTCWRRTATGSEPASYDLDLGFVAPSSLVKIAIVVYRGADPTPDASGLTVVESDLTPNVVAPSVVTTIDHVRLVSIYAARSSSPPVTWTPPAGTTARVNQTGDTGLLIVDEIQVAAGATGTRTAVRSTSPNPGDEQGCTVALKPAS